MESWVATRTDEQATLFLAERGVPGPPDRHERTRSPRGGRRRRPLLALLAIAIVVAVAQLAAAL